MIYHATLGISIRAYKTLHIEADDLLDLMNKAREQVETDFKSDFHGYDPEPETASNDTLCWAEDESRNDVIENVDLTEPEMFIEIARELSKESDNA